MWPCLEEGGSDGAPQYVSMYLSEKGGSKIIANLEACLFRVQYQVFYMSIAPSNKDALT